MEQIQGIIERITYQNEENGYTVIKVRVKGYSDLVAVTGNMASVSVGSVLSMTGEWKVDSKYGRQFNAALYSETLPATVYGIQKYLGSGLIKGIGPKYAKKIVGTFMENTLDVIENNPNELITVDGIGKKRVELIKKAWGEQREIKNLMIFLQEKGISTTYASRIYRAYGDRSIETITENPYKLADDIFGIGFRTADIIAEKLGIDKERHMRCRSGIFYALNELSNEGHCFAHWNQLVESATALLGIEEPKIVMTLSDMALSEDVIAEENKSRIYLPPFYHCESGTAKLIEKITAYPRQKQINNAAADEKTVEYDEMQLKAIECAVNSKFMVLTGGPGTGKTTTVKGIIGMFRRNGFSVLLAAPTGRAAKRMTETTGLESKTVHRLLELKPPDGYQKNADNQLEGDVIIIDESSMLDIILFYNLLKAVPPYMSVILIGDTDQLPSIGAGNVLLDIIDSGRVPVIKLEKIFRQAMGSLIIRNAHRINKGLFPEINNSRQSDFFFIEEDDNDRIAEIIVGLCRKRLPSHYGIDPVKDIQVLCPMQKSVTGVQNLNGLLQNALNKNTLTISRGGMEYRLGDKVMQIKNNYEKEVFNGDIGVISHIDLENRALKISFDGRLVEYDLTETDEVVLSYATTIHKSQGSEFDTVVMPLSMSHYLLLQRNLLYTGITRAKKRLVIVGSKKALYCAMNNNKVMERNTWLKNRLNDFAAL